MSLAPAIVTVRPLLRRITTFSICAAFALTSVSGQSESGAAGAATPESILINDNRTAAGTLSDGVLTIRLDARVGEWHPDTDTTPGVQVKAFAVEGGKLQIPAPLIRVTEGTEVRAVIRNSLSDPLVVHGLYTRPGPATAEDPPAIGPGQTREIRFVAGAPGTYFYWAAPDAKTPLPQRLARDSQLSGAFVVDPRDAPRTPDRILVMGFWGRLGLPGTDGPLRFVMNGRSWPHTERLSYQVGDTVRMRLINAGANVHPMHLHGFYFRVDSRGDERADTVFASTSSPRMVVTERLTPGRTFSLTWKPTRPGNWLFHCHDNVHLEPGGALDGSPASASASHHVENHALEMMAGPVMGITVSGTSLEPVARESGKRRQLSLVARAEDGGTPTEPSYTYSLEGGSTKEARSSSLTGPTIVLKRGEPVSITVVNQLPEPTAVHWHGIELESYYDGVAGYSGEGKRIAPAIKPGGSFEARFTPPRSGTFIYHTHVDEVRQQRAGLSGPLLVVDSPESYDPETDLVMMITVPRKDADSGVVLINGSSKPSLRVMRAGQRYRLRFINAHTFRPSMRMRILNGTSPLTWRAIAKDGSDLAADLAVEGPSEVQMGNGETYDFEFVPTATGSIRLDVTAANGVLLASMPIEVR